MFLTKADKQNKQRISNTRKGISISPQTTKLPIQRYVYVGIDSITPIKSACELPYAIMQEIDRCSESEKKELLDALEEALTDPDTPIRIHEDYTLEDIKAQLFLCNRSVDTISKSYKPGDLIVATSKGRKLLEPRIPVAPNQEIPPFVEDTLKLLKLDQGKIECDTLRSKPELYQFAIWLRQNMPALKHDHSRLELNLWLQLARQRAMHFFTRVSHKHSRVFLMMEFIDEAQLCGQNVLETDHLDPAYYDVLKIHDQFLSYQGLKPYSGNAIVFENMEMVRHGASLMHLWKMNYGHSPLEPDRILLSGRDERPSLILKTDKAQASPVDKDPHKAQKETHATSGMEGFEELSRKELKAAVFDASICHEMLSYPQFVEKLEAEHAPNFPQRRKLVPELLMVEAALQEYDIVKHNAKLLQAQIKQLGQPDYPSSAHQRKREKLITADMEICHHRLALLDELEHQIYAWHKRCPVLSLALPPLYHKSLFLLLETLHKEHVKLTAYMIQRRHKLWLPDKETLSKQQNDHVQSTWRMLSGDSESSEFISNIMFTGRIKFKTVKEFHAFVMSSFSRLLARPFGRKLVMDILANPDHKVYIYPTSYYDEDSSNCAHSTGWGTSKATAKSRFSKENPFAEVTPSEKHGGNIELVYPNDELGVGLGEYWSIVKDTETHHEHSKAMRKDEKSSRSKKLLKEKGYYIPQSGNYILKPSFVILGHELGHAKNYFEGTSRTNVHKEHYQTDPDLIPWRNNEEHYVITQIENSIREEHSLPNRQWHTSHPISLAEFISHPEFHKKQKKFLW
ncbi:hypothetical protein [Aureibacter tunicatorum]|uniref:Uncharacterized protein n=1 Tax=Aureibacter tunicatorum TaxID=866807 RepID=A0AAE3XR97_9BACT|nr:hypothetical protein [Aureibacter tunicatorum]MDR6240436.1 hypothetical protein [Aureibacter tunicatorum]BDD05685.1 hypothetical protein AUTU_31680 [Aureibacter tunicatorum]